MRVPCRGPLVFLLGVTGCLLVTGGTGAAQRPVGHAVPSRPPIDVSKAVLIGPTGGDISQIATSPINPAIAFATSASGGVFRSTNNGTMWANKSAGLPSLNVYTIAPHPTLPDTVYVGLYSKGVAKSTDGGATWSERNDGFPDFSGFRPSVYDLWYDRAAPDRMFAATDRGVYKTTNGGVSWVSSGLQVRSLKNIEGAIENSQVLYASDQFVIFKSIDGGSTWNGVSNSLPQGNLGRLAIDPKNGSIGYIGGGALFKTINGGTSWTKLNACTDKTDTTDILIDPTTSSALTVTCPFGATGFGAIRSLDSGLSWGACGTSLTGKTQAIAAASDRLLIGTDSGVFSSTACGSAWTASNTDLFAMGVSLAKPSGSKVIMATGPRGSRVQSVDLSAATPTFVDLGNPDTESITDIYVPDFGATSNNIVFGYGSSFYVNSGTLVAPAWQSFGLGITSGFQLQRFVGDRSNPNLLYVAGGYSAPNQLPTVFKADLSAFQSGWSAMPSRIPTFVLDLEQSPVDPDLFFAGGFDGLFKSVDHMGTWSPVPTLAGIPVFDIKLHPFNSSVLWANTNGVIRRSSDGGQTFNDPHIPNEAGGATRLAIDPLYPDNMYAGGASGTGLVQSTDGGATYQHSSVLFGGGVKVIDISTDTAGAFTAGTTGGLFAIIPATTPPPGPLTVKITPENPIIAPGDNVAFVCTASGGIPPYTFAGDANAGEMPVPFSLEASGSSATLTITTVKASYSYAIVACAAVDSTGQRAVDLTDLRVNKALLDKEFVQLAKRLADMPVHAALTAADTAATPVTVRAGGKGHPWTATANQPWIKLTNATGDGLGQFLVGVDPTVSLAVGTYTGTVTVTEAARGFTQSLAVSLKVIATSTPPIGGFDTPADGATGLSGSVAVTGWTVDDVGVKRVEIWRNCVETIDRPGGRCVAVNNSGPANFVAVGEANFVAGARPDIEAANPTLPQANRAGWGYLLLTNFLPHIPLVRGQGGQGTFVLYAYAVDQEDQYALLGSKTIGLDNDNATTPFGGIDTPAQGGTVTTNVYVNFGWAMAPGTRCIDTASIAGYAVFIDGVPRTLRPTATSTATQNWVPGLNRADLVALFPGLCNTNNALAAYYIDATELGLGTGVHTISWVVTDTAGNAAGIGSRFFEVLIPPAQAADAPAAAIDWYRSAQTLAAPPRLASGRVSASLGFGDDRFTAVKPDGEGRLVVDVPMDGRVVLDLDGAVDRGNQELLGALRPLPAGSTLDAATGRFSWQPPIGFLGPFKLVFTIRDARIDVTVNVVDPARR